MLAVECYAVDLDGVGSVLEMVCACSWEIGARASAYVALGRGWSVRHG